MQTCLLVGNIGNEKADKIEVTTPGGGRGEACVGAGKTKMSDGSVLHMKPPLLSTEHFKDFKPYYLPFLRCQVF